MLNLIQNFLSNSNYLTILLIIFSFVLGVLISSAIYSKKIKLYRKDAIKRSKAVINGQITEQFAPLFRDFPCDLNDAKFIGKPVDFVGFKGLDSKGVVDEVLFIEVKTGNSVLSSREKAIKDAIDAKKVRYVIWKK